MEDLLENIQEFWRSAEVIYKRGDYTSAGTLYFKCLFIEIDLVILRKLKRTPKDHTERFKILRELFPEIYIILDKLFPLYRDTYSLKIEKEKCDEVRKNVIRISEKERIQLNNK